MLGKVDRLIKEKRFSGPALVKEELEKAGIDMAFNTVNVVPDKDIHHYAIPSYQMSADEMKQYRIEKIQEEEEQKTSDATNSYVQIEQPNVIEQTEHMDLDSKEPCLPAGRQTAVSSGVMQETPVQPVVPIETPAQPAPAVVMPTEAPVQPVTPPEAPAQPTPVPVAPVELPTQPAPLQPPIVTNGDVSGADFLSR